MTGKPNLFHETLNSKLLLALLALILYLAPNASLAWKGMQGFFASYLLWSIIVAASIPLLDSRGRGLAGLNDGVLVGVVVVALTSSLGLLWGYTVRVPLLDPGFLLSRLAIVAVEVAGIEAGRAAVMGLIRDRRGKLVAGTLSGFFYGSTLVSLSYSIESLTGPRSASVVTLLTLVPVLSYNIVATELQVNGGLRSSIPFRLIVEGYWRASPLVLTTSGLSVVWIVAATMIYYGAYIVFSPGEERLPGALRRLFREQLGMARAVRVIGNAIFLALIAVLAYMLYSSIVPLVVISGSMEPTLSMGDVILVSTKDFEVGVGDIIAFWHEDQIVVHRVVGLLPAGYRTKGDALSSPDPFIASRESIVGKVVGSLPAIGWATIYFRKAQYVSGILESPIALSAALALVLLLAGSLAHIRARRGRLRISVRGLV